MMNKVIAENATKFAQLGNNARLTFQRAGIKSAVRLSPVQRPLPSHKGFCPSLERAIERFFSFAIYWQT